MHPIMIDISMSLDEREGYLIDLNEASSRAWYLRMWILLNGAGLMLAPSVVLAVPSLGLMGLLSLSSNASIDIQEGIGLLLMMGAMMGVFFSILVVQILFVWVYPEFTPRKLAAISAKRRFWLGINRFEFSSAGLAAVRTYSTTLIKWKKIKDIYLLDKAIYFLMGTKQINVALIPLSAFESQE